MWPCLPKATRRLQLFYHFFHIQAYDYLFMLLKPNPGEAELMA